MAPRGFKKFSFVDKKAYIYFIYKGKKLSYIGQTINLRQRIKGAWGLADYSGVTVYYKEVPFEDKDSIEKKYIEFYRPPKNKQYKTRYYK